MIDAEILNLFWMRSQQAFEETGKSYGNLMLTICRSQGLSEEDSEECVNDALLILWEHIPPDRPGHFKAYLSKVVKNLAISKKRREISQKRGGGAVMSLDGLEELIPSEHCLAEEVESGVVTDCINDFLAGETEADRRLFVLRYWFGLSQQELADRTGLSRSALNRRLNAIINRFRKFAERRDLFV